MIWFWTCLKHLTGETMQTHKIKKGNHRPAFQILKRLWLFRLINSTPGKERVITFDKSWKESDPNAWHKLFGFSNGFNHHHTSCRWVAKYNQDKDVMDLALYYYVNGVRKILPISEVNKISKHWVKPYAEFDKPIRLRLSFKNNVFEGSYWSWEVNRRIPWDSENNKPINRIHVPYELKKFGWFLGLYHGGKKTSPVDLIVYSDKYL